MSALASIVWPRLVSVSALLALTLLAGHETRTSAPPHESVAPKLTTHAPIVVVPFTPAPLGLVINPEVLADASPWPRGMVIAPPATGDSIAAFGLVPAPRSMIPLPHHPLLMAAPATPAPLDTLLSGLFELFGSRSA